MPSTSSNESKILQSEHVFLFPFKINDHFDENIFDKICTKIFEDGWKNKRFQPDTRQDHYNNLVYFHPYVHQALFPSADSSFSRAFERHIPENSSFEIKLIDGTSFKLKLKEVSMQLFTSHVGILSIRVQNYCTQSFDEILMINDYGRRIYPQFLDENCDTIGAKNNFLPDQLIISINGKIFSEEHFLKREYQNKNLLEKSQPQLAKHIRDLIGPTLIEFSPIHSAIDDRMFCMCWVGNKELSDKFTTKEDKYKWQNSEQWYKFVFVDGKDCTCRCDSMLEELIKRCTYRRWEKEGTLSGISRYSFVNLTNDSDYAQNILRPIFTQVYSHMVVLLLTQRASILTFAQRAANISLNEKKLNSQKMAKEIAELNLEYTKFQTNLCFDEVTPQEQGIEIYTQAREAMRIEEQLQEVKDQISNLDSFANIHLERTRNSQLEKLNVIAGLFLPISIIISIWGMGFSFIKDILAAQDYLIDFGVLFFSILTGIFFTKSVLNALDEESTFDSVFSSKFWKKVFSNKFFLLMAIVLSSLCFIA